MMTDHAPMTRSKQGSPFMACRTLRHAASTDNTPTEIHKTDLSLRFSQTRSLHGISAAVPGLSRSTAPASAWRWKYPTT